MCVNMYQTHLHTDKLTEKMSVKPYNENRMHAYCDTASILTFEGIVAMGNFQNI